MERDLRIDFLRFLGLSLVIIAHIQAPFVLTQIRSFDVPLMVFVSGLTSSRKNIPNYWLYIWKRSTRLIVPVWLFLAIYLFPFYFLQGFVLPEKYLTGKMILRSFLLLDKSIGYVWIIRVFLLVMFITPLIIRISHRIKSHTIYICFVVWALLANQILFQCSSIMEEGTIRNVFIDLIVYGVAYSVPFALGVRMKDAEVKSSWFYIVILFFTMVWLCINCTAVGNNPIGISSVYKFPPRPYFIVYGTLISAVLWATKKWWSGIVNNRIIIFVGQNTIWIYLWHMPLALYATVFMHNWMLKYIFVYGVALLLFYIQFHIVKRINIKTFNKYLLG